VAVVIGTKLKSMAAGLKSKIKKQKSKLRNRLRRWCSMVLKWFDGMAERVAIGWNWGIVRITL
jgi:hypothetical protein